jgi:hypothetical protein
VHPSELTKEDRVVQILREMPDGSEISLKSMNDFVKYKRLYDLFEVVQKHLNINYVLFNFVKEHPLEESLIIKKARG